MASRLLSRLYAPVVLIVTFLGAFTATSYAAAETVGDDPAFLDLAKSVYEAFANHQYSLMVTLAVVLLIALFKRYAPGRVGKFVHGNTGGTLMTLVGGAALAMSAALVAPDARLTFDILKAGLVTGIMAAGGYAVIKNVFVKPILVRLEGIAPAWMKPLFDVILWVFDHSRSVQAKAIAKAEAAGTAAMTNKPSTGVQGVVGKPTELE